MAGMGAAVGRELAGGRVAVGGSWVAVGPRTTGLLGIVALVAAGVCGLGEHP